MPSTVAVVEHATHGPILFCTGVNHHVADPEATEAPWEPGLREAYGAQHFTREHAIGTQLRRLGHRPEDVRYVALALRDDPRTAVAYRVIAERRMGDPDEHRWSRVWDRQYAKEHPGSG